jgi:hypothetical protein
VKASSRFFKAAWAARFRRRGFAAPSSGRQRRKKLLLRWVMGDGAAKASGPASKNFLVLFFKKVPLPS